MQENVFGLYITVHHALPVRVVERAGDFARDAHRLRNWQLFFALETRTQRFAGHEWHHVVQQAVGLTTVEQRQNVRMLQARGGADLGQEPFAAERGAQIGVQHLDRDVAVVLEIVREIDGGHATGAEFAENVITVGEGGGEPLGWCGHGIEQWKDKRQARKPTIGKLRAANRLS